MSYLSRSPKPILFESVKWCGSEVVPGVRFAVRRPSLGQRIELTYKIQELMRKHEFLKAGADCENVDATLAELLGQQTYLRWGLAAVENLLIDGEPATADLLIDRGPEDLVAEIVVAIQHECGLTEEDKKN